MDRHRLKEGMFVFALLAFLLMALAVAKSSRKTTRDRFDGVTQTYGKQTSCMFTGTDLEDTCSGDANINGRLFFGDPTMNRSYSDKNNTDAYYMQKVVSDQSSLRLTINDNSDESFQIWGDACGAGNCNGEGRMAHKFQANGNVVSRGDVAVGGSVTVRGAGNFGGNVQGTPGLSVKRDLTVDGSGNFGSLQANKLVVDGQGQFGGKLSVERDLTVEGRVFSGGDGRFKKGTCVQGVCVDPREMQVIKNNQKEIDDVGKDVDKLMGQVEDNRTSLKDKMAASGDRLRHEISSRISGQHSGLVGMIDESIRAQGSKLNAELDRSSSTLATLKSQLQDSIANAKSSITKMLQLQIR